MSWDGHSWSTVLSPEDEYYGDEAAILAIEHPEGETPILVENRKNQNRIETPWSLVRGVRIVLKNDTKKCPDSPILLSNFDALDHCPLDSITHLEIDYTSYDCRLIADIDSLPWLHNESSKSLKELVMFGSHAPDLAIKSLSKHPIRNLQLTTPLGKELEEFKHLRLLEMPGIRSAFAHHASNLPHLVSVSESDGMYRNRFHHHHAEYYFWLRCMPTLEVPIDRTISVEQNEEFPHPLHELLHLVGTHLSEKLPEKGELFVSEDELPPSEYPEYGSDTLIHGFIDGDTLKGIWTLRVSEQYFYSDEETFHLDLDTELTGFPENGMWKLNYASGDVAISGNLRNGNKEGEWLFYKESGALACRRYYSQDTIQRTVVYFDMNGYPLESRGYYSSPNASIQALDCNGQVQFIYVDQWMKEKDPLVLTNHSISILKDNGKYEVYYRNHPDFETIYRKTVIDKVYPEYIGKELPFTY